MLKSQSKSRMTIFVMSALFFSVSQFLSAPAAHASSPFASGTGTQNDPYIINSCHQFQAIGTESDQTADRYYLYSGSYFKLGQDIDCVATSISDTNDGRYDASLYNDGAGFTPFGYFAYYAIGKNPGDPGYLSNWFHDFILHLDGDGHTISNLTIYETCQSSPYNCSAGADDTTAHETAIVGRGGGSFSNLHVVNANINGGRDVAILFGVSNGTPKVTNVTVSGTVTGTSIETALIGGYGDCGSGYPSTPTFKNVSASGTVSGTSNVGGLIGYANGACWFKNIQMNATVEGSSPSSSNVGGLIGYDDGSTWSKAVHVDDSYVTGTVVPASESDSITSAGGFVGSLLDSNNTAYFHNSFSNMSVEAGAYMEALGSYNGSDLNLLSTDYFNSINCAPDGEGGGRTLGCNLADINGTLKNTSTVAPFKVGNDQIWDFLYAWQTQNADFPTLNYVADPTLSFSGQTPADTTTISSSTQEIDLSSTATGSYSETMNWNNSLVGWWRFDNYDDASDYSGNTFNGTNHGATWTDNGKLGGAYSFNGTDSYIGIADANKLEITGDISISAWVKTSQADGERMIFAKYDGTNPPYAGYGLLIDNGFPKFWSSTSGVWVSSTTSVADGAWHLVTVTGTGSTGKFYVDGADAGSFTYSAPASSTVDAEIGINPDLSHSQFNGLIDDVQLYNRALSAAEVTSLYDGSANHYANTFTGLTTPGAISYQAYQELPNGIVTSTESRSLTVPDAPPAPDGTITTCQDFENINNAMDGDYVLNNDLDCTTEGSAIMVGNGSTPFNGTFNGQGHTIKVQIAVNTGSQSGQNVGLFRYINGASITNLRVKGSVEVYDNQDQLAGSDVGGLVGSLISSTLTNDSSWALVRGGDGVGGLVGAMTSEDGIPVSVTQSYAQGDVYGNNSVGGLVGQALGAGDAISTDYARGNVFGFGNVGGLVGDLSGTNVSNAYARGNVSINYIHPVAFGTYHISQYVDGSWVEKYAQEFSKNYETKSFIFQPVKNHNLKLQINQKHIDFGDIDQIQLKACDKVVTPEYARYVNGGQSVLDDILQIDKNVVVAHESPVEVSWNIPSDCNSNLRLDLTANEYGPGSPLSYMDSYKIGHPKDYSPNWVGTSGHPQGPTFVHVRDDANNVYVTEEVTSDNTNEKYQDWTDLKVNGKTYLIDGTHSQYGTCVFGLTDKVTYKHNTCNYVIPKSEIGNTDFSFTLRYYGTLSTTAYGGLIGIAEGSSIIHDVYSTGNVNGDANVGGLIGQLQQGSSLDTGFASNFYVNGFTSVGAVIGQNNSNNAQNLKWFTSSPNLACVGSNNACTNSAAVDSRSRLYADSLTGDWDFETTWDNMNDFAFDYYPTLRANMLDNSISENPRLKGMSSCNDADTLSTAIDNGSDDANAYYVVTSNFSCALGSHAAVTGNFPGVFDGNGHTINVLSEVSFAQDGLFAELYGGTAKNVTLTGDLMDVGNSSGALAGNANGYSLIDNVNSTVNIDDSSDATSFTGGIVGAADFSVLTYVNYSGTLTPHDYAVGGIAGQLTNGVIAHASVGSGQITGIDAVGGLVGNMSVASIYNSKVDPGEGSLQLTANFPNIGQGASSVGGLVGDANYATIATSDVHSGVNIKGFIDTNDSCMLTSCSIAGGLVGYDNFANGGQILDSNVYSGVTIQGYAYLGGAIGYAVNGLSLNTVAADATFDLSSIAHHTPSNLGGLVGGVAAGSGITSVVSSSSSTDIDTTANLGPDIGGLIGSFSSDSSSTYFDHDIATGDLVGSDQTGGLIGNFVVSNGGTISDSYATGNVSGSSGQAHGGFIGSLFNSGTGRLDVSSVFAHGNVTGSSGTGGLFGAVGSMPPTFNTGISNVYSWGTVNGSNDVGGIIGFANMNNNDDDDLSELNKAYASGNVTGTSDNVGGLIGFRPGSGLVRNSFYTGAMVSGTSATTTGTIVGESTADGGFSNLYYGDTNGPTGCIHYGEGQIDNEACTSRANDDFKGEENTFMANTLGFDNTWSLRNAHYPDLAFTTEDDPTADHTPPVITLLGSSHVTINVGDTYHDAGATATDNVDGNLTSHIVVGGDEVNTAVAGTYHITYDVSDSSENNAIRVVRTVTVQAVSGGNNQPTGGGSVPVNFLNLSISSGGSGSDDSNHGSANSQEGSGPGNDSNGQTFSDVSPDNPHFKAIQYLFGKGIIKGFDDKTFKPHQDLTRAEMAKIVVLASGATPTVDKYNNCFPDVKTDWYAPYVCYAKEKGWVGGYGSGKYKGYYRPAQVISKVEILKILLLSEGIQLPQSLSSRPYTDVPLYSWYAMFVAKAKELGLFDSSTGNLIPDAIMDRGTSAEYFYRVLMYLANTQQEGI